MKKIKLTADFTTTATKTFTVDDDFDPANTDLDDLWFSTEPTVPMDQLTCNLQYDEVWLVRDENDNDLYVK